MDGRWGAGTCLHVIGKMFIALAATMLEQMELIETRSLANRTTRQLEEPSITER